MQLERILLTLLEPERTRANSSGSTPGGAIQGMKGSRFTPYATRRNRVTRPTSTRGAK